MGKHNDKAFKDRMKMEMAFREHLERQLRSGVAQGVYAACKVIHDRLTDEGKALEDRVESALAFCKPVIDQKGEKSTNKEKAGD